MNPPTSIDLSTFQELQETMGADFIVDLVQTYAEETPQLLAKLQEALARQDFEAFRRSAHSIKSTSNSLGALQYGEMAKELEMMGRAANLEGASAKVQSLAAAFEGVKRELERLSHEQ